MADEVAGRPDRRTTLDNETFVRSFHANMLAYLHAASRVGLWGGGFVAALGFAGVLLSGLQRVELVRQVAGGHIGSFAAWAAQAPAAAAPGEAGAAAFAAAPGEADAAALFRATQTAGWLMVLLSGFGVFVAPRWEPVDARRARAPRSDGCSRCLAAAPCTPLHPLLAAHTKAEMRRSWVVAGEGRLKLWWGLVAPLCLFLSQTSGARFRGVGAGTGEAGWRLHAAACAAAVAMALGCEAAQLHYGERVLAAQAGFRTASQKGRAACVVLGLAGAAVGLAPVEILRNTFFQIERRCIGTASARMLMSCWVLRGSTVGRLLQFARPWESDGTAAAVLVCEALAGACTGLDYALLAYAPPSASLAAVLFAGDGANKKRDGMLAAAGLEEGGGGNDGGGGGGGGGTNDGATAFWKDRSSRAATGTGDGGKRKPKGSRMKRRGSKVVLQEIAKAMDAAQAQEAV